MQSTACFWRARRVALAVRHSGSRGPAPSASPRAPASTTPPQVTYTVGIGERDRDLQHRQRHGRRNPRRRRDAQTPSVAGRAGRRRSRSCVYRVTNTGNGPETFRLRDDHAIAGDKFDPVAATPSIYFDTDASGDLSPRRHCLRGRQQRSGAAADAFVTVFVVNDIPAGVVDGNIGLSRLTADARTGTGAPGTVSPARAWAARMRSSAPPAPTAMRTGEYLVAGVTRDGGEDPGGPRPVRRHASGSGRAHHLHDRRERHGHGHGGRAGVHRQHSGQHHLRARLAAPQQHCALGRRGRRRRRLSNHAGCARARALGTLTQASGSQTIQFAVTIN